MAVHPAEDNGGHELYFMCDDLKAEISALGERGVGLLGSARSKVGVESLISDFPAEAKWVSTSRSIQRR